MSMTEERIDHEKAKHVANKWLTHGALSNDAFPELRLLSRAYLSLLTESTEQRKRIENFERYVEREIEPKLAQALTEQRKREERLRELVTDLISYSHLREKVRLRDDPTEYAEAERLIARAEALASPTKDEGALGPWNTKRYGFNEGGDEPGGEGG